MDRLIIATALVFATAAAAGAQGRSEQRLLTPIKLRIVFEKYQGDKRVTSEPYTLSLNANDRAGKIRMGIDVPMRMDRVGDREVPGNTIYRSVGNAADCTVTSLDESRFKFDCSFEQSSISSDRQGGGSPSLIPPMLRTFRSEAGIILTDNQTAQYATATDPVSGEVLKVLVSLSVMK